MRTIERAAKQTGIPEKLIRAVIRQTGKEHLREIAKHGADGGYPGFIYYADTVSFYRRNRAEILNMAREMADQFGQGTIEMIAGFRCLKENTEEGKRKLQDEIGRALLD